MSESTEPADPGIFWFGALMRTAPSSLNAATRVRKSDRLLRDLMDAVWALASKRICWSDEQQHIRSLLLFIEIEHERTAPWEGGRTSASQELNVRSRQAKQEMLHFLQKVRRHVSTIDEHEREELGARYLRHLEAAEQKEGTRYAFISKESQAKIREALYATGCDTPYGVFVPVGGDAVVIRANLSDEERSRVRHKIEELCPDIAGVLRFEKRGKIVLEHTSSG